ncbi:MULTISPECIES: ROK family protein [unclassified Brevibacterium]|jgi:predicted NBD/HSP70 family sugar kinase|uniref:ROK family protein n=1 Tax=unclassified Brevibacterium TaxID=2614124 RepID=UPI0036467C7B
MVTTERGQPLGHQSISAADGPRHTVREWNERLVLDRLWAGDPLEGMSTNDLISQTGLTRATVLAQCEDLQRRGLIVQGPPDRQSGSGRPGKRFFPRARDALCVGVDAGLNSVSVAVADVTGRRLGGARIRFADDASRSRAAQVRTAIDRAIAGAEADHEQVRTICFGFAAPIAAEGSMAMEDPFWREVEVDLQEVLHDLDWAVSVHNDANLAAIAERHAGAVDPAGDFVMLLAGERFGAGIVDGGHLLTGARGGAGEMVYLEHVEGVRSTEGLGRLARKWAERENARGVDEAPLPLDPHELIAQAAAGRPAALRLVDDLSDRLARVVATLSSLLNPQVVVVSGATALEDEILLRRAEEMVADYAPMPVRIVPSKLGGDAVVDGAIAVALEAVRDLLRARLSD